MIGNSNLRAFGAGKEDFASRGCIFNDVQCFITLEDQHPALVAIFGGTKYLAAAVLTGSGPKDAHHEATRSIAAPELTPGS
jgi:hypothetical protein